MEDPLNTNNSDLFSSFTKTEADLIYQMEIWEKASEEIEVLEEQRKSFLD